MEQIVNTTSKRNRTFTTTYSNGQMEECVTYKDGKREGLSETWHPNGQIEERTTYKNGKLDGVYDIWHENNQMWDTPLTKKTEIVVSEI